MKKIIICLLLLCGFGSTQALAIGYLCPADSYYTEMSERVQDSMLYAIHDCKTGNLSYVLGTFHTSNAKVLKSIAYVKKYVSRSKQAWFEINLQPSKNEGDEQRKLQQMMLLPSNSKNNNSKNLQHIIGADYFAKMLKLLQRKNPNFAGALIERYKPWAAAITLQMLEIEIDGTVMDDMLQQYAKSNKIEVKALETAMDQLKIFDGLSDAEQLTLLQEAIDNYDVMAGLSKQMMAYYLQGELHNVAKTADDAMKLSDAPVNAKLEDLLVHKRNAQMVEKLKPVIGDGIFVAVGALHLSGKTGLLQQFEDAGYGVYGIYE